MKLVEFTGKTGDKIYVNPEHVSCVVKDEYKTVLHLVGMNNALVVRENIKKVFEEIDGSKIVDHKPKTKSKKNNGTKKDM